MKKIFTLAAVLFSCMGYGKTTGITIPTLYPHFGSSRPDYNAGGMPIRLTAKVKTIFDGSQYQFFDSSTYSYSSGRGGILDLDYQDNFLDFDLSVYYQYDPSLQAYMPVRRYTQSFNDAGDVENRIQENWINDQIQWHNGVMYEYHYNPLSRLEQTSLYVWNGSWTGNSMDFKLSYNNQNDITEIKFVTGTTELSYDANHNVTERKEYIYTTAEGWHYSDYYSFSYDAANHLTSYTLQKFANGAWSNSFKKEFIFTNGVMTHTIEYSWKDNSWQTERRNLFSYDAGGNKLDDAYQVWDDVVQDFVNTRKEEWTYNAQNQPLTYKSLTWNAAAQAWQAIKNDFLYRYKYEYYTPTLIAKIPDATEVFTLYPQPASDVLNLHFHHPSGTTYQAYIYDMRGSVVKSMEVSTNQNKIPLGDIPSGNYLIGLHHEGKKIAQPIIIAH